MSYLSIEGGAPLHGELTIQGSKNSVLPVLAATILARDVCRIENCPRLRDVDASVAILRHLGCRVRRDGTALEVDTAPMARCDIPDELMREMRSSIIFSASCVKSTLYGLSVLSPSSPQSSLNSLFLSVSLLCLFLLISGGAPASIPYTSSSMCRESAPSRAKRSRQAMQ